MRTKKDIIESLDGIGVSIPQILDNQRSGEENARIAKARNLEARKIWEEALAKTGTHYETSDQPEMTTKESPMQAATQPREAKG